jgi:hypothetical protein
MKPVYTSFMASGGVSPFLTSAIDWGESSASHFGRFTFRRRRQICNLNSYCVFHVYTVLTVNRQSHEMESADVSFSGFTCRPGDMLSPLRTPPAPVSCMNDVKREVTAASVYMLIILFDAIQSVLCNASSIKVNKHKIYNCYSNSVGVRLTQKQSIGFKIPIHNCLDVSQFSIFCRFRLIEYKHSTLFLKTSSLLYSISRETSMRSWSFWCLHRRLKVAEVSGWGVMLTIRFLLQALPFMSNGVYKLKATYFI